MTRVALTGASGFAGSHCLEHLLRNTDWEIACIASFRHRGKADRITGVLDANPGSRERVTVITHDLTAPLSPQTVSRIGEVDYLLAYASESHVDRSITDPVPFVRNNVDVALSTLEYARQVRPKAVVLVSTDEVYGPVLGAEGAFKEWARIIPSNPYAGSKAAAEAIAISYWRTYGVPLVIVNCINVIGQRQSPEKFLPKTIGHILRDEPVPIHGRAGNIGTRHYMHARNLADALLHILGSRTPRMFPDADRPDRYNIADPEPVSNLALAEQIAAVIGRELRYELIDFHSARPGHDPHYGLDPAKLAALGWKPPVDFRESVEQTVLWTVRHPEWLIED